MNCQTLEDNLWLFLYEEMTPEEQAAADAHLQACSACRAHVQEAETLRALLSQREEPEAPPELLVEARMTLDEALDREELGWRAWFRMFNNSFPVFYASRAVAVMTILVMGFGLGWVIRPRPAESPSGTAVVQQQPPVQGVSLPAAPEQGYRISNISELEPDPVTGKVQITFDAQRQVTFSGSLDDPRIQQVLLYAVRNYENPGIRRDTLDLLRDRPASREIRETMIFAMLHDPNDGVRIEALEAAEGQGWSPNLRDALLTVLQSDTNPGVRVAAVNALVRNADDSVVPVLREISTKDSNKYVRLQCASAVRELEQEEF
jgi:hypothetical protein